MKTIQNSFDENIKWSSESLGNRSIEWYHIIVIASTTRCQICLQEMLLTSPSLDSPILDPHHQYGPQPYTSTTL